MTRPPRATKRYREHTKKRETHTHTHTERERERSTHLWAMTRDDDVCNSLSSTKASQCRFWERVPFPISFKDTHGEKSASNSFLFFFEKLLGGLDSVYVSPLSSSLRLVSSSTKEETSQGPPLLVGFFCANTKNDTAKERESSSRWLRCETKKVGVPFDESPLPFCLPFPRSPFSLH